MGMGWMKERWRFTGLYDHPEMTHHKDSSNLLRWLRRGSIRPWLCMRDLNEILYQHEKQGAKAEHNGRCRLSGTVCWNAIYRVWRVQEIYLHGSIITTIQPRCRRDWIGFVRINGEWTVSQRLISCIFHGVFGPIRALT
ncbi:UNVERIFIED_CONTAM: hypothetical protein Sradi_6961900 [Sesamum radiatum]|uniref:Uncharacterized protein n=1 Tax=Sesamum radiatum TaxID=300843 RepID=A0AAW2JFI7_SESRA